MVIFCRFNNAVWLVMNDVILGSVVGAFVCENSEVIGKSLHDWLKVRYSHVHPDERRDLVIIRYVGCLYRLHT
jgi:N-acetylglucosaminyl transferase component (Gpi1)